MKKIKLLILMLLVVLTIIFPLTVNASQIDPDNYQSNGPSSSDVADMYKYGGSVAGVIFVAGIIVSIGTMMVIGIRYLMAGVDEKAEYKERMIPYFIGAILLFGASTVVRIVYLIFN